MITIIGAGISGLTCAAYLKKSNIPFIIYEKTSLPGGRVQTLDFQGHKLDIGFQVFNPKYPEVIKLLSPWKLRLKKFQAGAKVWDGSKFVELIDPRRSPLKIFKALKSDIGIFRDRLKILKLIRECNKLDVDNMELSNQSTFDFLHAYGFSDAILDKFFFPFFKGIFLEKKLQTDSTFMKFVFKMFSSSYATLPKDGMRAVSEQLEKIVGKKNIQYNYAVKKIKEDTLVFENGAQVPFEKLVIATGPEAASELLGSVNKAGKRGSVSYYFTTDKTYDDFLYLLNGSEKINHIAFVSDVQKSYSKKQTLISVVGLGAQEFKPETILKECEKFFGEDCKAWNFLKSFKVPFSLPDKFSFGAMEQAVGSTFFIGDYVEDPSLNGAMRAGRKMAEKLIQDR